MNNDLDNVKSTKYYNLSTKKWKYFKINLLIVH